jgi:hypothetical protein
LALLSGRAGSNTWDQCGGTSMQQCARCRVQGWYQNSIQRIERIDG